MPKFIGRSARPGSVELEADAWPAGMVRLTYAQQLRLPAESVHYSLDTSDRGGPGSYAKRWNRWFASPGAILRCVNSTPAMLEAAGVKVIDHPKDRYVDLLFSDGVHIRGWGVSRADRLRDALSLVEVAS